MVAGAADDPALEHLGDAGIEALGLGAKLRGQVAGEDGRQLVRVPQDDQVVIVGRSPGSVAHEYRVPNVSLSPLIGVDFSPVFGVLEAGAQAQG
jgi:hypothetical protein